MSIESRLAAKKRSAKARSKARAKAAFDLGLIILIPVAVLVIVFLVMNHIKSKVNDYSKYLTSEGNIKDYDISKEVTIPDLSTLPVKYDDFKPTDATLNSRIAMELKSAIPEAERPDVKEESEAEAAYLAMLTDENVEKYFAEKLGDKYAHTADGYRAYLTEYLQHNSFHNDVEKKISDWLLEQSTIGKFPSKYVKNWTQIMTNVSTEQFEAYKKLGLYTQNNIYELYGSKKAFKEEMQKSAESNVKQELVLLAAFDKLGLTCTKEDAEAYFKEHYEKESFTMEDIKKEYGEPYMMLECKCYKVMEALKAKIHTEEEEDHEDEQKTE